MKKYLLCKKEIGSSKKENILSVKSEEEILNFTFFKDDYLFLSKKNILIRDNKEFINFLDKKENKEKFFKPVFLFKPQDFLFEERKNTIHVLENGGSNIKSINLNIGSWVDMNSSEQHRLSNMIKKYNESELEANFCFSQNIFYISIDKINRIFSYKNGEIQTILGDGYPNYSVASDLHKSKINNPKGICANKNRIYFCDYGNGIIRSLKKDIRIEGEIYPRNREYKPKLIKLDNKKIYFLSNNKIYNSSQTIVHSSENKIISFGFKDRFLYLLEEENE